MKTSPLQRPTLATRRRETKPAESLSLVASGGGSSSSSKRRCICPTGAPSNGHRRRRVFAVRYDRLAKGMDEAASRPRPAAGERTPTRNGKLPPPPRSQRAASAAQTKLLAAIEKPQTNAIANEASCQNAPRPSLGHCRLGNEPRTTHEVRSTVFPLRTRSRAIAREKERWGKTALMPPREID
jgi:hypothetical protein